MTDVEAVGVPNIRVGDAERDEVAGQIRDHYAVGRLTHEEMTERLEACLAARTAADLQALTADLPPPAKAAPARPRRDRGAWVVAWRHWASVSLIVWAIWAVTAVTGGGAQGLWPLWVSGPWAAVLVSRAVRGADPRLPHEHHRRPAYRHHNDGRRHHC